MTVESITALALARLFQSADTTHRRTQVRHLEAAALVRQLGSAEAAEPLLKGNPRAAGPWIDVVRVIAERR